MKKGTRTRSGAGVTVDREGARDMTESEFRRASADVLRRYGPAFKALADYDASVTIPQKVSLFTTAEVAECERRAEEITKGKVKALTLDEMRERGILPARRAEKRRRHRRR